ncbi:HAD family phosphatase [Sphingosinicella sp. BN140058]|uniref:HAD family hydrolase n=1 Tax=Sphingosinicella sp. BN140058 TaxID=1892855 RepID=UPI001011554A|nr:HAD family phosphatase [Sphingosinicella sp. BN140058]QAY76874.1 HAD family phosphatase [Sphingosinicella sp. BN140058]
MTVRGLIFDFDGVLLESEYAGNLQIADYLTRIGHPTTPEHSMAHFMGLSGPAFLAAIENWIGRPLPDDFHAARAEEDALVLAQGLEAVAGAVAFIEALPPTLPKAIASSSSSHWITTHLDHLKLRHHFGDRIFSGAEHVARGKPAPDLYLLAADKIGVNIEDCAIIEDSPVGVTGAVVSGAKVIGLCAGRHCGADHAQRLRELGVRHIAASFDDVAALLFGDVSKPG